MNEDEEFEFRYRLEQENASQAPKMTMEQASQEQSKAQARVNDLNSPVGILQETTGIPKFASNLGTSALNILKAPGYAMKYPKETAIGLLDALKNPVGSAGDYISSRYGSLDKIKNTAYNDPVGTILDATVLRGIGGLAKTGIKSGIEAIPKDTPEQLIGKAEQLTQRILSPSKDVIADALLKKSQIPAVREAAKVIRKSPNEKALLTNLDDAIKTNFSERNSILESNNYRMTDKHIRDLENFINERKSSGQLTDAEIGQMTGVLNREKAWYAKNKNNFDRVTGQKRKEELQELTKTLLEKKANGETTITQPARKQALDILRNGLKEGVEGNDLRVRNLNATYGGLLDAKSMLADQAALVEQNLHKGVTERLLLLAQSLVNPRAMAINTALRNAAHISKMSAKVERLMSKANGNRVSRVIEDAIAKENKPLELPYLTPKYLQERINAGGSLGVKGKPVVKGIPEKETIQKYGAPSTSKKATIDLTNKDYQIKNMLDESYENAIKAKKKRMINLGGK